jgi:ribosomal protein S18 acetylase RimI-like enzyme
MPQPITIRRAGPAESGKLTALAHRAKASWGYPSDWIRAWEADLTLTPAYIEANRTYVAEYDGHVAGLIVLQEHPGHWTLEHAWIDPASQGRGIGRRLVTHALDTASRVRPVRVEVVSDPNSEPFYRKLGALRIGSCPAPMPGAPTRILPVLEFPPPPPVASS